VNVATGRQTTPGYPTRRQFLKRNLAGVAAAIGLTAAAGQGQDGRLRGDVAVEPRASRPAAVKPSATLGRMPAEPQSFTCVPTNGIPSVAQLPRATVKALEAATTNQPVDAGRLKGEMPAAPKEQGVP